jgi:hypothetical protein
MVFKATFNNMSVISWRSILLVDETGIPEEIKSLHNVHIVVRDPIIRG